MGVTAPKSSVPSSIPLSLPSVGRRETAAVLSALRHGALVGRGQIGLRLEKAMARDLGAKHVLLTTSGSHALELAMAVLELGPGDEVILPSFTFSSVANAVLRQKAKPVFCDVLEDTLNIDPADAARRITKRTRAIIPVHYAGVACDMKALRAIARPRRIALVEDAAHAVGASAGGKALGSIGAAGCMSFHATKNVTCGEGGAFITSDDELARRAEWFREKGTNRSEFLRGEVRKYTWVSEGSSYVLSDLLASVLEVQWARRREINRERGVLYARYMERLAPLQSERRLRLPSIPAGCISSYHLFHILLPTKARRDRVQAALRADGIGAAFHYQPLHASPFGRSLGRQPRLPVTESAADRLLRLPLYAGLKPAAVDRVCARLEKAARA